MDQFTNFTRKVSANLTPFAEKVGTNFSQLRQIATEKMSNSAIITELPREYVETENRFEPVKHIHADLVRLARKYALDEGNVDFNKLQNQFIEITSSIGEKITNLASQNPQQQNTQNQTQNAYKPLNVTIQHQLASACISNSEIVGASLYKFGSTYEKIGDFRVKMNHDILENCINLLQGEFTSNIELAQKSRKDVQGARLALDALKSSLKGASSSKQAATAIEIEKAEEVFIIAVQDSMKHMKFVLGSPIIIESLRNFAAAQLEYFKESQSLLETLVTELEEIKLTQDALYYSEVDHH
ncbi:hypothetical protein BB560_003301 [Smittium megazygosporum]|uniref:BAR domain-containing protein n=1 Tax=Smittium megazygosporum TaxID=133381 RepID=A0A2T9ZCD1_9FUNG|nr:hypothetical protein BB560_003301 [Smittium megazygosporum]